MKDSWIECLIINIRWILCENTIKITDQVAEENKLFSLSGWKWQNLFLRLTWWMIINSILWIVWIWMISTRWDHSVPKYVKIFNSLIQYSLDPLPPLPSILSIIKKLMCRPPCSDVILAHTPEKWKSILYAGCASREKPLDKTKSCLLLEWNEIIVKYELLFIHWLKELTYNQRDCLIQFWAYLKYKLFESPAKV